MDKNTLTPDKLDNAELLSQCVKKNKPTAFCGIYLLVKDDRIIYIGQSVDIEYRIRSHYGSPFYGQFDYYLMYECEQSQLRKYERIFIERFFPKHNNDSTTVSQKVKIITARLKLKQDKDKREQFLADVLDDVPFENRVELIKQVEHRFFDHLCILKTPLQR